MKRRFQPAFVAGDGMPALFGIVNITVDENDFITETGFASSPEGACGDSMTDLCDCLTVMLTEALLYEPTPVEALLVGMKAPAQRPKGQFVSPVDHMLGFATRMHAKIIGQKEVMQ
jgi:hypothetical protein